MENYVSFSDPFVPWSTWWSEIILLFLVIPSIFHSHWQTEKKYRKTNKLFILLIWSCHHMHHKKATKTPTSKKIVARVGSSSMSPIYEIFVMVFNTAIQHITQWSYITTDYPQERAIKWFALNFLLFFCAFSLSFCIVVSHPCFKPHSALTNEIQWEMRK